MNNRLGKKRLVALFIACVAFTLKAMPQSVVLHADIDSIQIYIGEQTKIRLETSIDANQKAVFPIFNDTIVKGLEIVEVAKPDTQYLNERKRLHITQEYTVTAFEEKLYQIPPFRVTVDDKPYESEELALKVYTFPVDTLHSDQFFGQKTVMEPPFAWADWAPIIWLSLLAIPLAALLGFLLIRFYDNKPIIRKVKVEPKLPPHEQAMKEISRIKEEKIWKKGRAKEYYTELTEAIRTYIRDRFGFNALEMTSSEIIDKLLESNDKDSIQELKNLFVTADLVKFAKHDPLMNENDMNLVNAIDFINTTKQDILPDQKAENEEITIEEKRSKRTKLMLGFAVFFLAIVVIGILVKVGMHVYELCF